MKSMSKSKIFLALARILNHAQDFFKGKSNS